MAKNNNKIISDLLKNQNHICADCNSSNVTHASYNIGIFICSTCASIHDSMGKEVSKTKNIILDHWEDSQIERLKNVGNANAKIEYERYAPPWWRKGREGDPLIILQQWIYNKYIHSKFKTVAPTVAGIELEGFLKEADGTNRRFVLKPDILKYYIRDKEKIINLENLDVSLKKFESRLVLQLDYLSNWSTRHLYVYHEEDEEMIKWFNFLRGGIFETCRKKYKLNEAVLVNQLNSTKVDGYLWKAGPSPSYAHRRRFFMLYGRKLMYHQEMTDPYAKGEIFLGSCKDFKISPSGYGVDLPYRYSFSLHTPYRTFVLAAETEIERDKWVAEITSVLDSEMTARDLEMAEKLVRKRPGGFLSR